MGPFCGEVYGVIYRVLVWGRTYVRERAVGLRSSGEPDRALRRARMKQRRRRGLQRQRRADSGGRRVDSGTTEAGGFGQ